MRKQQIGVGLGGMILAGLITSFAGTAQAQTSTDTTAGTGKQSKPAPTTLPPAEGQQVSNPPPPPARSFLAPITDFGQYLKANGIYLQLGYSEAILSNVDGGNTRGTYPTGETYFGGVLDLQTIAGIPEASFHITFDERNGYGLSGGGPNFATGTQGPLQANSGPTRVVRLSEFYWEQGFDKDRIDIIAGRTNPTSDFATSLIACNYVSSVICAQPGSWYFSNNNAAYPASTWGARINVAPAPDFYVRAGVYENDLGVFNPKDNGFNWFNTQHSDGVFVPVEVGYASSFTDARYPAKYDVGAYLDASTYQIPGGGAAQSRTAWWVQGQQAVWRPDPTTTQSLTLLGGAIVYQGGAPYWSQVYAGAVVRAPFGPARADDTFNVIGSYYGQNSAFSPNRDNQWIFEVNYNFSVIPGISVQPVTQYVLHPNEIGFQTTARPDHAWVVGVQLAIDAGTVLKFPQFVPY